MLTLPIKKKWLDMIGQEIKKVEYRATTQYYITRFANLYGVSEQYLTDMIELSKKMHHTISISADSKFLCLRAGYSSNSPSKVIKATLSIGGGISEWGAVPNEVYFCLQIVEVIRYET